ncbi:MAG: hypothetical protein ACRELX_14455 [Longimicrobiales bacterium]
MYAKILTGSLILSSVALGACDVPTAAPRFETTFVVPAEAVTVLVTSRPATATIGYDLNDVDRAVIDHARGGALRVDIVNAAGGTGVVQLVLSGGGVTVEGSVDLAGGSGQRIPATESEVRALLGRDVMITASGTLCPPSGCDASALPPFSVVTFRTSLELLLELGGES